MWHSQSRSAWTNQAKISMDKYIYIYVCMYVYLFIYLFIYLFLLQNLVKELVLNKKTLKETKDKLKKAEDELLAVRAYMDTILLRVMETNPSILCT